MVEFDPIDRTGEIEPVSNLSTEEILGRIRETRPNLIREAALYYSYRSLVRDKGASRLATEYEGIVNRQYRDLWISALFSIAKRLVYMSPSRIRGKIQYVNAHSDDTIEVDDPSISASDMVDYMNLPELANLIRENYPSLSQQTVNLIAIGIQYDDGDGNEEHSLKEVMDGMRSQGEIYDKPQVFVEDAINLWTRDPQESFGWITDERLESDNEWADVCRSVLKRDELSKEEWVTTMWQEITNNYRFINNIPLDDNVDNKEAVFEYLEDYIANRYSEMGPSDRRGLDIADGGLKFMAAAYSSGGYSTIYEIASNFDNRLKSYA